MRAPLPARLQWLLGITAGVCVGLNAQTLDRDYLLNLVREAFRPLGFELQASRFDYNVFLFSATLTDVQLRSTAAPDLPPFLKADRVQLNLELLPFLKGSYLVQGGSIENPTISILFTKGGRNNLPKPTQQSGGKTEVHLENLAINSGKFQFEDQERQIAVNLPLWQMTVHAPPASAEHQIYLETRQPGRAVYEGRPLTIQGISGHLQYNFDNNSLTIDRFTAFTPDSRVKLSGGVKDTSKPVLDLNFTTEVQTGTLARFAGVKEDISGRVTAEGAATGPPSDLKVQAKVTGTELAARGLEHVNLSAQTFYDAGSDRVRISDLLVKTPPGTVAGKADIALTEKAGRSTADVSLRGMNLQTLSRLAKAPVQVASVASGTVEANWPALQFEKAEAQADLKLEATRELPAEDVLPVSAGLHASYSGNRVAVTLHWIRTLAAGGSGSVTLVSQSKLGGLLKVDANSISDMLARLDRFLGKKESTLGEFKLDGPIEMVADLGGTLKNPVIGLKVSGNGLQVSDAKGVDLSAEATYESSALTIRNASVKWRDQTVLAYGTVGLEGKQKPLDLHLRLQNTSIPLLLATFNKRNIPAAGVISGVVDVSGTVDSPLANIDISGRDIAAYSEPLGTLSVKADYAGNVLRVTQLQLDKQPDGILQATGEYNTQTKAYTVSALMRDFEVKQMVLPGGTTLQGRLNLTAKGGGTTDTPALDVTLNADNLNVDGNPLGTATAQVNLAGQTASFDARLPSYKTTASGHIGVKAPYPTDFRIVTDSIDLATLPYKPKPPISGVVTATITGSGELENWKQGHAVAQVEKLQLKWKDEPIRSEGPLRIEYANESVTVSPATIVVADSRLQVSGTLPLEQTAAPGDLSVSGDIKLKDIAAFVPEVEEARGELLLNAALRGSLQRLDPTGTLVLKDGYLDLKGTTPSLSEAAATIEMGNGTVRVASLTANWAGATISATGELPLGLLPSSLPVSFPRKQGPAVLSLDVKNLNLAAFKPPTEKVSGSTNLHAELQTSALELKAVQGQITLPDLRLSVGNFALKPENTPVIELASGTAQVKQFTLAGPDSKLELSGSVQLDGAGKMDLRVTSNLNAAILAALSDNISAEGDMRLQVAVTGTLQNPQANGFVQFDNAQISLRDPAVQIEEMNMRLDLSGDRLTVSQLTGFLNGGPISGSGSLRFSNGGATDVALNLRGEDVYMNVPAGLKTVSNLDITARSRGQNVVLGGKVTILEGSYTDNIALEGGVLQALQSGQSVEFTGEPNPLLSKLRFNLAVVTTSPIVVNNNLAKAAVDADLRLVGNYYQYGLTGRAQIEEGGEVYLNERTYLIDRGILTFVNQQKIEPVFDVLAKTQASGYDITLNVQGSVGNLQTTLTSDPALGETDIIAVLLTGRTLQDARGAGLDVAKQQAMSYVAGRLGQSLSQQARRTFGLSTFRLEPGMIAAEANPTARLTVGQDITRQLSLIYSMDLANSGNQIWIGEYDITRRFVTRAIKQEDNSYRLEFRHDLRFGGTAPPRKGAQIVQRKIAGITFSGNTELTKEQLASRLKLKAGDRYDFFKVHSGLERIKDLYASKDLLEARIRLDRQFQNSSVLLNFQIRPGPKVQFVYEGWSVPSGVQKKIREIWRNGVFDAQRAGEAVYAIQSELVKDGYLQSTVDHTISKPEPGSKRVLFEVTPGPQYHDVKIDFEGASGVDPKTLHDLLDDQKLTSLVYIDYRKVVDFLERYYSEQGYLSAKVKPHRLELNPLTKTGRVVIPIDEGVLFKTGSITFEGNHAFKDAEFKAKLPLVVGQPFKPALRADSYSELQKLYWSKGYNDVDLEYRVNKDSDAGTVAVWFRINEGKQRILESVDVAGTDQTSKSFVRGQMPMKIGEPLTFEEMNKARSNLYSSGAFTLVDLEVRAAQTQQKLEEYQRPVRLVARVNEVQPFQVQYGGFYDTDRGPGGIVDFSNHNTLGNARVLGLRTRYDSQLKEARLYFSQPLLRTFPLRTSAVSYITRETHEAFITDRIGFTVEQEARFGDHYVLNYGYRIEKTHTYDRTPDPLIPFDITRRVAPLTATLARDTRDDVLDATHGSLASQAFVWGPAFLGSELRFVRYFGQYYRYFPLSKPVEIPLSKGLRKSRLVYATAVRLGLATGLGEQELIPSERFFAGGGTTIRGFKQDQVGPKIAGEPVGGNALLILNNEIRFPIYYIFDGAGFVDVGNVYRSASDFALSDLRKSAGIGLRVRTPYIMLRLDWGFKLDRRTGEPASALFFSIGQAF